MLRTPPGVRFSLVISLIGYSVVDGTPVIGQMRHSKGMGITIYPRRHGGLRYRSTRT
jgi:hypothetical protein